ncbi:hypothetical protein [uncultured Gemmiger sp.]|uniref:hypothetical protein n=1 Tax=uncultured Gemmiger sp. TaxID=1623490 RepID=UPI0025D69DD8|nr:hypothetical protein [uncultured Gemmiger sp.]
MLFARCVHAVCSAALAACCLLAGRGRPAVSSRPQGQSRVQCAGQALETVRRRLQRQLHRAARALALWLAMPSVLLAAPAGVWVELKPVPAGHAPAPRALRLPAGGPAARPGRPAPPGDALTPPRVRAGPVPTAAPSPTCTEPPAPD